MMSHAQTKCLVFPVKLLSLGYLMSNSASNIREHSGVAELGNYSALSLPKVNFVFANKHNSVAHRRVTKSSASVLIKEFEKAGRGHRNREGRPQTAISK